MPPSATALELFSTAEGVADNLYFITITDPWYKEKGGNWQEPTLQNQGSSMGGLFAAINARRTEGDASLKSGLRDAGAQLRGRQVISMSPKDWLTQGKRVMQARHGVCTDCAAAVACSMTETVDDIEYRMEIVSSGQHAFVIINRDAGSLITQPSQWGADAFGIDVWMQNQFPRGQIAGAFWVTDRSHGVADFIHKNAPRLNVDAALREVIGSLF